MGLFNMIMGNASETDIREINKSYAPILCKDEVIERAFSHIRDKWIFTNKRLIIQNTQGVTGKKKEFLSIPYQSVACFSVETAGTFDEDAEMKLWVRGMNEPIEINFGPGTDMEELQKLIAEHILK